MKKNIYYLPHLITLTGLAFAVLALISVFNNHLVNAARYSLLVLAVDRIDGTMARKLRTKEKFPGTSGEILDIITDLVGLTFVPMMLFWKTGLFIGQFSHIIVIGAVLSASWKYSRKEGFLERGYSIGAPPIYFSLFLFYFLKLPALYPTVFALALIILVLSPVKFPINSLVTTHWKPGFKSITNYLTAIFFIPVFVLLHDAPAVIYWVMLTVIIVQLTVYPVLLSINIIKPVFDRNA